MDDNFSPRVKDVIAYSKEEALRLGHNYIGTEHLMLGILRDGSGKAISILSAIEVDLDQLRQKVEILNPAVIENNSVLNEKRNLHLTRQAERAQVPLTLPAAHPRRTVDAMRLLVGPGGARARPHLRLVPCVLGRGTRRGRQGGAHRDRHRVRGRSGGDGFPRGAPAALRQHRIRRRARSLRRAHVLRV